MMPLPPRIAAGIVGRQAIDKRLQAILARALARLPDLRSIHVSSRQDDRLSDEVATNVWPYCATVAEPDLPGAKLIVVPVRTLAYAASSSMRQ